MVKVGPVPTVGARSDEPPAAARSRSVAELSLTLADLAQAPALLHAAVVGRIAALVGEACVLLLEDDSGSKVIVAFSHPDAAVERRMRELSAGIVHLEEGFAGRAWRAPGPLRLQGAELRAALPLMSPPYRAYFAAQGLTAMVLVPLRVRGATVGLLGVTRGSGPAYDDDDVAFLGQVAAVVAVAVDNARLLAGLRLELAAHQRTEREAWHAAQHDELTGLPNRRALSGALDRARRTAEDVALLVIDVDGFKHVNDAFGHSVGDELLVAVSRRLERVTARHTPGATLARLGGDEFAVVLAGQDSATSAVAAAAAVVASFGEPFVLPELELPLAASVGVATSTDGDREATLLRLADIAMYRAKRERTGWARHDPARDERAGRLLREVAELRDALTGKQLELHYQPLVPAGERTGLRATGHVEALVRWCHPTRGRLLPADFLPLAADAGLMTDLTTLVVDLALDQAARWRRAGTPVQVAVNVPASVLAQPDLPGRLLDGLRARDLPTASLAVELTESELVGLGGLAALQGLRDAGLDVALDDFGTGYSSLAYLADVPATSVKIDRAFVARLRSSTRQQRIVRGIVECAHGLGLTVVAEGVEHRAEAELLAQLGVDLMQGYLFSRPVVADAVTPWLARRPSGSG